MNSYFFPNIPLQSLTSVYSAPRLPQDRQFHPGCDQLHSVSLLIYCVTVIEHLIILYNLTIFPSYILIVN